MKKKVVLIILIIFLSGLSVNAGALNENEVTEPENNVEEPKYPYWDGFCWCTIKGTYQSKSSNDKYQLMLSNDDPNERTIRLTGQAYEKILGSYIYGFASISTDLVKAERFIGYCKNGQVFGFCWADVIIGYPYGEHRYG